MNSCWATTRTGLTETECETMAFERFEFTKSWEDAAAFPAYEPDEAQVRADLQCLHDEARDGINRLIDALNSTAAAASLPITPVDGMTAQTVQAAIEEVFSSVSDAAAAKIVNGSVTKEKLEASLLKRIYGGRVQLSLNAPTAADNPGTDLPVGQLWLRPAMTVENLASDEWEVEGGTMETADGSTVFTTDGSQDFLKATQRLAVNGTPGQQVVIRLQLGELSSHLEDLCLYFNGLQTEPEETGLYEAQLDDTGALELVLLGQWPYAEDGASIAVTELTAVNLGALEAQYPEFVPPEDPTVLLLPLQNADRHRFPMTLWIQVAAGRWEEVSCDTTPVSHGGTGLTQAAQGTILYGTGAQTMAALSPAENGILQCSAGVPVWTAPDLLAQSCGYLRTSTGTYEGTGGAADRRLTLPVAPKLLFLFSAGGDTACLANGGRCSSQYTFYDGAQVFYRAWAGLSGSTLTFSSDRYGDYAGQMLSCHMNEEGVSYTWLALF